MNEAEQAMSELRKLPPDQAVPVTAAWMIELLTTLGSLEQRLKFLEGGLARTQRDAMFGGPRF